MSRPGAGLAVGALVSAVVAAGIVAPRPDLRVAEGIAVAVAGSVVGARGVVAAGSVIEAGGVIGARSVVGARSVIGAGDMARAEDVLEAEDVGRDRDATVAEHPRFQEFNNVPYDAGYTFVRVRFSMGRRGGFARGFGGRQPPWAHDFPHADNNFVKILDEVTLTKPSAGTNVIDADSPELHRYPVAYVSEPGYWSPTQAELDNVSAYLQKGGFLILDDFRGEWEWQTVQAIFAYILPGQRFRQLTLEEPIFNAFFEIETLDFSPPTFRQYKPYFLGIHENDDPSKRLQVVANLNNDIGDYWEYSDMGYYPIDLSNEAYKVGINYVIYALTR